MKKILYLICFFVLCAANAIASEDCTVGDNDCTVTCDGTNDHTDLIQAITDVAAGATIHVASGTCDIAGTVTINKSLTLSGNGTANTIFSINTTTGLLLQPATPATDAITVTGIHFNSHDYVVDNRVQLKIIGGLNNVISDNLFEDGHDSIYSQSRVEGVVHSNQFLNCERCVMIVGDNDTSWERSVVPGGSGALFVENNTFTFNNDFHTSVYGGPDQQVYHQNGGRTVVRYNTFDLTSYSNTNFAVYDSHGNWGGVDYLDYRGQPLLELYGNLYSLPNAGTQSFAIRGGSVFIHHNKITTANSAAVGIALWEEEAWTSNGPFCPTSCPVATEYPALDQITNSYFWNNLSNVSNVNVTPKGSTDAVFIQANRDYWNYTESFNGTSGVGCGTTKPGTCTTGTAFWETSQSCSDLTDYTDASPTTPISGTLYKCTATNTWTAYYQPYTYPHPLRGEADIVAPTATWEIDSTGLIATGTFSETVNATTKTGVSFTGSVTGAITATYKDGMPGGIVRYDLNATVQQDDTVVVDYTTPGDGIKDLAGNALADISDGAVTNGSTQKTEPYAALTIGAHTGATVNVYPGINCGSTCGPVDYDVNAVLTINVTTLRNYTGCTIGGTGCGASTTMSEARTCTVSCTKISPDVAIGSGAAVTLGSGAVAEIK